MKKSASHIAPAASALLAVAGWVAPLSAQSVMDPADSFWDIADVSAVPVFVADPIDFAEVAAEDAARASEAKPVRFAVPNPTAITPAKDGLWEEVGNGKYWLWRMRITNENAAHLNFGFAGYRMPEGGRLLVYPTFGQPEYRAFTSDDNAEHGQLWTPVVSGNDAMIEVLVPAESVGELQLDLGWVNTGYRGFGAGDPLNGKSGSCNVDVVCPDGIGWENEIAASGAYSVNGTDFCSGSMINNTEGRDYFLTADHCGVGSGNDQGMVIYWNYQNSTCRTPGSGASGSNGNGSRSQFNSGTIFRGGNGASDWTIVELEEPIDPSYMVSKAGWDRSGDEASTAVAIHHPGVEEKRISFEFQPTTTTNYLSDSTNPSGTHVRVDDWDTGTTEPGSSGSPLFDQNKRIIGQLHGGFAACGNNDPDWYGRISVSWFSGMQQLLAPFDPDLMFMDTDGDFTPSGIRVTPGDSFVASGPIGGPFVGDTVVYTIENASETESYNYQVTTGAGWLDISNASGSLAPETSTNVTVSLNASADSLGAGVYESSIAFTNLTDGDGSVSRDASLDVGKIVYTGAGGAIPDQGATSFTINIPDSIEIADVQIGFDINHTWVGDLIFDVEHDGTTVVLGDRPGVPGSSVGFGDDINGEFIFSDAASAFWETAGSWPPGEYKPVTPLAVYDGTDAQGLWTLSVSDNAGLDTGSISEWSVIIVPAESASCPGDLSDSSGFGAPDSQIDFGDFFALSFLAGPCGGGTTNPDCDGDLSDTSGFGAPDSQIDFGDFFALSFLAGPCP